jgi:hypothetical protein
MQNLKTKGKSEIGRFFSKEKSMVSERFPLSQVNILKQVTSIFTRDKNRHFC